MSLAAVHFRLLKRAIRAASFACLLLPFGLDAGDFQGATHLLAYDEDPIRYSKSSASGSLEKLRQRLESKELKLAHDSQQGYLPALLDALGISTASQALVFSKTSMQRDHISPKTPRALFYNDDVYVGYIPGAPLIEISMADPKLGGVFYTLEQRLSAQPQIIRNDQCLECHASAKTMGVPGHLLRSFATDEKGAANLSDGAAEVNHRTPLADRWGGWYVTGSDGGQAHRGNLMGAAEFQRHAKEPGFRGSVANLSSFFSSQPYPHGESDIVSLMTLEHQIHLHNYITRLHFDSAIFLAQYGHVNYTKHATEGFLRYLLFTEEAPLTAPIHGSPAFVKEFESQGPFDPQGRSLRQFDLQTRLFKYPCSYLIYSEAFDSLPQPTRERIYQRLWDILTGKDETADFKNISADSRRAILEILVATKRGLPDYWKL